MLILKISYVFLKALAILKTVQRDVSSITWKSLENPHVNALAIAHINLKQEVNDDEIMFLLLLPK